MASSLPSLVLASLASCSAALRAGGAAVARPNSGSSAAAADLRGRILLEMLSRYAHPPPEEQWDSLIERAVREPEDPCDADILSTFGWSNGWGSGFNTLASEVAVAAYFNRTVAICHPRPAIKDLSMWELLRGPVRICHRSELCESIPQYDQPGTTPDRMPWGYSVIFWGGCLDHDQCDVTLTHMPKRTPAERFPGISPAFRNFSTRFRHRVYGYIYRFEDATEARAGEVAKMLLPGGPGYFRPFVGVHIRGTDKFREAVDVGIEPYVESALRLTNLTGARAVYLASDDFNRSVRFKELFEAKAPPSVAVHMKARDAYPRVAGGWNVNGYYRIVLMAEVKLLVEAAAFVGSASSNLGRLVYFLRPQREGGTSGGDLLEVSVDEGNDFLSRHC